MAECPNCKNEMIATEDDPEYCNNPHCIAPTAPEQRLTADQILDQMAETYRERNKVYGDNYLRVGEVMAILFPEGTQLETVEEYNVWHLFELMVVKLTRFANTNLTHIDSIHDLAVYAAMVEVAVKEKDKCLPF